MDLFLILVAGLAFVLVAAVGFVVSGLVGSGGKAAKRAQTIGQRGRTPRGSTAPRTPMDAAQRRKQLQRAVQDKTKDRAALFDAEAKLRQAGFNTSAKAFWMGSGVLGLVMGVLALVLHMKPFAALMMGFVGGAGLPLWLIGMLAGKRKAKFSLAFADAVDIIVRGLRSGLPLHDCLKVIGRECPEPLAGEFRRLVEGLAVGVSLEQGLDRMHERMPTPELKFFAIVLNIQQKTGGNLGEALGNLSGVLRGRRMMREKIGALSMEAVASAGVIGCLPPGVALLITATNPHYLDSMFQDPRGHMMLAGSAVVMATGIFVMRKMINFKF